MTELDESREYFSDFAAVGSGASPSETPYFTPRPSASRRSSRRTSMRDQSSSPPPPMPSSSVPTLHSQSDLLSPSEKQHGDEKVSPLDPRRFTPTLHASLVSEILTLRRDLESKSQFIDELESHLTTTKSEKDDLTERYAASERERRTLKRQVQQVENSTLAALEELAKDRDGARESNEELKSKLEAAHKRIKGSDDDAQRFHSLWEKDKQSWEAERRGLERRVHVTETRLKSVLEELASQHAALEIGTALDGQEDVDHNKDSGIGEESDTASILSSRVGRSPRKRHNRMNSKTSLRSIHLGHRASVQSFGPELHKSDGLNLADELQLDEEDEHSDGVFGDEDDLSENETPMRRGNESRQSHRSDEKAMRVLGIPSNHQSPVMTTPSTFASPPSASIGRIDGLACHPVVGRPLIQAFEYVDTGVQWSPPSSPTVNIKPAHRIVIPEIFKQNNEIEANQRRKRVSSTARPSSVYRDQSSDASNDAKPTEVEKTTQDVQTVKEPAIVEPDSRNDQEQQAVPGSEPEALGVVQGATSHVKISKPVMVSAAMQTVDKPISPPATPKISPPSSPVESLGSDDVKQSALRMPMMATASTQTDLQMKTEIIEPNIKADGLSSATASIPAIVIEPPVSSPSSPKEALLPQRTKNASCQTSTDLVPTVSTSVQTEEIRFNKTLLAKLPPHLHPSSISSTPILPYTPKGRSVSDKTPQSTSKHGAGWPSHRLSQPSKSSLKDAPPSSPPLIITTDADMEDRYPGNNDNGPLTGESSGAPRRPFRDSSLFAGFTDQSAGLPGLSDEDEPKPSVMATPPVPPRASRISRLLGNRPSPVPEEKEVGASSTASKPFDFDLPFNQNSHSTPLSAQSSFDQLDRSRGKQPVGSGSARSSNVRRSALIQNGATQTQLSRASSVTSAGSSAVSNQDLGPPFAIPDRASSKGLFSQTKSEGSRSPTPRSGGLFNSARRPTRSNPHKDNLRKVRSATTIQRKGNRGRGRSFSPPLPTRSPSSTYEVTTDGHAASSPIVATHEAEGLREDTLSPGHAELGRASQGSVVDAIAACMVGEWMFKYVRRRKSFGVPESPQDIARPGTDGSVNVTGSGVRHKRWVWLSPYERSIMWSSKQPQSNNALMGKTGRKLTIQSVLDVRDDTPLPRNHGITEPFQRSILILTPARALKFTALSEERHYAWLTALSFLAHSPLLASGLTAFPDMPSEIMDDDQSSLGGAPAPSLRRSKIHDSVRIAKDKAKGKPRNITVPSVLRSSNEGTNSAAPSPVISTFPRWTSGVSDSAVHLGLDGPTESAEAPSVPRYSNHGRKRSMTSPGLLHGSWGRALGYTTVPTPTFLTSSSTIQLQGTSQQGEMEHGSPMLDGPRNGSVGTPSPTQSSTTGRPFLDPEGTIRMDAFVEGIPETEQPPARHISSLAINKHRNSVSSRPEPSGIPPLPSGAAGFINKANRGRRASGLNSHPPNGEPRLPPAFPSRGARQASGPSGEKDSRRSGIVYPDDFDAFDPFKHFS